ncbi:hypothetical protein ASPWEDRAFT_168591 [Aspergillus wentii DTO 134E9]|uniref:Uncharacterized protein n=1 Tax=Aspergillus wentii DTO 134E9 TaxID=1073089 RepID=A0A1L9RV00_ASPWE|nr:uncharacterized protein ASPWEDRAFT_168591 [Aspergillus wentii DTO 134E9]KAI9928618.1 hypothetical protein MW887_001833 [Aspergillus wentii]OJJ38698.1 hypothetical protein ASPWEDRAFT_168591 [Aspergillus wentii DTO 134E9]
MVLEIVFGAMFLWVPPVLQYAAHRWTDPALFGLPHRLRLPPLYLFVAGFVPPLLRRLYRRALHRYLRRRRFFHSGSHGCRLCSHGLCQYGRPSGGDIGSLFGTGKREVSPQVGRAPQKATTATTTATAASLTTSPAPLTASTANIALSPLKSVHGGRDLATNPVEVIMATK